MQSMKCRGVWIAGLTALTMGMGGLPRIAVAQDKPATDDKTPLEQRVVALDLEDTDLYAAFTLLFKQVKANYTLDPGLRGNVVTVHVKLPFRKAVETLLRASGLPITLQIENGVYSIVPVKTEEASPAPVPTGETAVTAPPEDKWDVRRMPVRNLNAIDIAVMLGGKVIPFTASYTIFGTNPFHPNPVRGGDGAAGATNGAPGAATPAPKGGANGKSSGIGFLPNGVDPDNIYAFDMEAEALFVMFGGP